MENVAQAGQILKERMNPDRKDKPKCGHAEGFSWKKKKRNKSRYNPASVKAYGFTNEDGKMYYSLKMDLGEKAQFIAYVRTLMKKQQITVKDLAEILDRPQSSLYNFFSLKEPKGRGMVAADIANYFHIAREDWIGHKFTEDDIRPNAYHIESTKAYKKAVRKRNREKKKAEALLAEQQAQEKKEE